MLQTNKPRLGVLALMLGAYEPLFPGITVNQQNYVMEVLETLKNEAEFVFPRVALGREDIEELTRLYNHQNLDGILVLLLSYSQGQYVVRAMQNNRLPLALALIQPDETVGENFEEYDLTVNQGVHGSQDNANCLMRAGIPCVYYAGSRHAGSLNRFISDFSHAAMAVNSMKTMKIGVIGKLAGMGDVITDDMAFFRTLGPEFVYDSIGTITRYCEQVTEEEINNRIKADQEIFDMDPKLTVENHSVAIRMYLGIKKYLESNHYSGYTAHFEEFGADGRYTQLPLLAASHLMADGYGYAAEGDATTAALMAAMFQLCGNANFSEMYMMDLPRNAILFCHAGEGNWLTCRKDKKPRLIDRVFNEGGLSNPPTPIFTPEPGPASVLSLVHISGNRFKLVCAHGEILDKSDLRKCEMPYFFFSPASGVSNCVTRWLEEGGTHHEAVVLGDIASRIRLFCRLAGIELVEI